MIFPSIRDKNITCGLRCLGKKKQRISFMRPDEIMNLPSHVSLILRSGNAPVKVGQWIWYKQSVIKGLFYGPSFVPTQMLTHPDFTRMEPIKKNGERYGVECLENVD